MNGGYVYLNSEPGLFTVGFYDPSGKWHPESDHDSRDTAAERASYLNGGSAAMPHIAEVAPVRAKSRGKRK